MSDNIQIPDATEQFKDFKQHFMDMKGRASQRNENYTEFEEMYLLDPGAVTGKRNASGDNTIKTTISPAPRIDIQGAIRLLVGTDPKWKVERDKNDPTAAAYSDALERLAARMMQGNSRITGIPLHQETVFTGLLYSKVIIGVSLVSELVRAAKEAQASRARVARLERLERKSPLHFTVYQPKTSYSEHDQYGLSAFGVERKKTIRDLAADFGEEEVQNALGSNNMKATDSVPVYYSWDLDNYGVWIEGGKDPLVFKAHELPAIPVVDQLVEGTYIFDKEEQQVQPFLYSLMKTELWKRQNLSLTVLYSLIFALGGSGHFAYTPGEKGNTYKLDNSTMLGIYKLMPGDKMEHITGGYIDSSLVEGYTLAERLGNDTTIYRQALGQPLSGDPAFSTVSLMSQSGRLPLVNTQRSTGWGWAEAMQIGFDMMRDSGDQDISKYVRESENITLAELPDDLELECHLEIDMPQDRLQAANIAQMITSGDKPLASQEWARENVLQIGQSAEEQRKIWSENASGVFAGMFMQQMVEQMKQMAQPPQQPGGMMPPGGAPGMGQPGMMQPGMEGQMPGGGGFAPGGGAAQGPGFDPGQGGLPPVQAGMQPGTMPPEQQI